MKPPTYQMVRLALDADDSLTDAERKAILAACRDPLPRPTRAEPHRQAEKYLLASEAAGELGVSGRTLQRWMAAGTIPSLRVVGRRRIPLSAVRRLLGEEPAIPFPRFPASTEDARFGEKDALAAE